MKTTALIILTAFISVSCRQGFREKSSVRNRIVIDSLTEIMKEKDSALACFTKSFSKIESVLESIGEKQYFLLSSFTNSEELDNTTGYRVNDEINSLNSLLENNRKEICLLNNRLASDKVTNENLNRIISALNEQLDQKEEANAILNSRITALNVQMRNLRSEVDSLSGITDEQSEKILEQSAWLNTAYYISGSKKELYDLNILKKTKHLRLRENLNRESFNRVEYQEVSRIPLLCNKAQLASIHPAGSYEISSDHKKNLSTLKILKPDEFWSQTKYLVIVTE